MNLFKKSLYSALVFFGTITVLSIGYGAYSVMTPVISGQPLTIDIWNTMIANIDDLNTRVDTLTSGASALWSSVTGGTAYMGGKVGIGTATPNTLLHIYNTGANAEIDIQSVAWANKHWGIYNERTNNSLRFWNNDIVWEKNAVTMLSNGNMGIGTTTPAYKLDITGQNARLNNSWSTAITYFDVANAYGTTRIGTDASGVGYLGTASNLPLALYAGNTERMRINTTGNIGIGTPTPTAKLDIRGQDQVENHYMAGLIDQNSGDRKIIMRHTITNTNSYYKLSLPQTYSNHDQNGGIVTLSIVWLGRHAIASCSQEYKLVYGTYHTLVPSYLNISQASRMFSQCSPYSYSYAYDQAPDVDFWVDGTGGFLVFNIKWMHVQSTERLINIEILGQTASIPVLSYYGTSLPAGTSALAETILH
ncbi:MAG: hypothetical protein ACD_78C00115G0003 [uncultured bacterium (gcode 4)]|uniref:Uncharacterized protein n=1 Tax=uncultured bacterium (gcode 4) TaxID=1234023 RepID=K1YXW1_9BACT|nr:MAG: hypothetical protein ACD_78C00115G0003 [uncultured bacterium (gcode 4)]